MTSATATALTPGQYAQRLGVKVHTVLGWINSDRDPLRAIDVSVKPSSGRPRWRIPLDAIVEFEQRRSARGPIKAVRRRKRKKQAEDFVSYF